MTIQPFRIVPVHAPGLWSLAVVCLGFLGGCLRPGGDGSNAEQLAAYRSLLLLSEEPPGAVGVEVLWEQLAATSGEAKDAQAAKTASTPPQPIVLVGRIGGPQPDRQSLTEFPWDQGRAAFVVTDPSFAVDDLAGDAAEGDLASHHGHSHTGDDHDCPFCKAKQNLARAQAIVQFSDDQGEVIRVDARELFQLQGDELVVIRGQARLVVGMLLVDAEALYVRR